jgi:hypothetical protein
VVELLSRAHEPDRAFLNEIEERQTLIAVVLRDRDDESEIRRHHALLGAVIAALDPFCELDFLSCRQERHLADVFEEKLERIGRDLRDSGLEVQFDLLLDFGILFVYRLEELVLLCIRVELVERSRLLFDVD